MATNFSNELLVTPGKKVKLSKWDPEDTLGWEKDHKMKSSLDKAIERLDKLQYLLYAEHKRTLLIVLQGLDASGKDGTIRHVMSGVNPQGCTVVSFKKPSADEASHDYLWRIHKAVPEYGNIGIFNRSLYEDVLVVRVHNLVPKDVWSRRYDQINKFEELLHDNNVKIVKFFLHISKDEQKKRFQQRIDDPDRRWKISEADFDERQILGRLHRCVRSRAHQVQHRSRSLVHHPREQEMVPESRRVAHRRRDARRHAHEVPAAHGGREKTEMEIDVEIPGDTERMREFRARNFVCADRAGRGRLVVPQARLRELRSGPEAVICRKRKFAMAAWMFRRIVALATRRIRSHRRKKTSRRARQLYLDHCGGCHGDAVESRIASSRGRSIRRCRSFSRNRRTCPTARTSTSSSTAFAGPECRRGARRSPTRRSGSWRSFLDNVNKLPPAAQKVFGPQDRANHARGRRMPPGMKMDDAKDSVERCRCAEFVAASSGRVGAGDQAVRTPLSEARTARL